MDQLSILKKHFGVWLTITALIASASFALGYLYRGQSDRTPIIIKKNSS